MTNAERTRVIKWTDALFDVKRSLRLIWTKMINKKSENPNFLFIDIR